MLGLVVDSFLSLPVEVDVALGELEVHLGSFPERVSTVSGSLNPQLGEISETRFFELG